MFSPGIDGKPASSPSDNSGEGYWGTSVHAEDGGTASNVEDDLVLEEVLILIDCISI